MRCGRLRWFQPLEQKSGDDWVPACRYVEVARVRCKGRNRNTWIVWNCLVFEGIYQGSGGTNAGSPLYWWMCTMCTLWGRLTGIVQSLCGRSELSINLSKQRWCIKNCHWMDLSIRKLVSRFATLHWNKFPLLYIWGTRWCNVGSRDCHPNKKSLLQLWPFIRQGLERSRSDPLLEGQGLWSCCPDSSLWLETWILYRKHVKMLESFHMRHLRIILGIRWQDNIEVINRASSTTLEALLIKAHMAWHKICILKKGATQMVGSCSTDGWHTVAKNCSLRRVVLDRLVVIAGDTRTPWRFCGSCIGLFTHLRAHNRTRNDWILVERSLSMRHDIWRRTWMGSAHVYVETSYRGKRLTLTEHGRNGLLTHSMFGIMWNLWMNTE